MEISQTWIQKSWPGEEEGCRRALGSVFPHWAGAAPGCWSCFTEPWGGAGQVPGVQHFVGALLCPWDAPVEVQALGNCSCPPWEPGFEQRKSYRALMLISLTSGM